jgi:hypothetical protein
MTQQQYDANDTSAEAWRSRMAQQDKHWSNGTPVPAELTARIERDADAAMARAIAKHGRD